MSALQSRLSSPGHSSPLPCGLTAAITVRVFVVREAVALSSCPYIGTGQSALDDLSYFILPITLSARSLFTEDAPGTQRS